MSKKKKKNYFQVTFLWESSKESERLAVLALNAEKNIKGKIC